MTYEEFKNALTLRRYRFVEQDGKVIVNHFGYVYLRSLTSLPEGVEFRNGGYVYLPSLTSLPEGIEFRNDGYVDLRNLTSLPEGTEFRNGGYVYLHSLTEHQQYMGQVVRFKNIDGYTMRILSEKSVGEFTVYRAAYFKGGPLSDQPLCYVAADGNLSAHGDTIKQAIRDLRFKVMSENFDCDELVEQIKERGTVSFYDYRLITGACESGLRHGLEERGIDPDTEELPLADVLKLCADGYGGSEFRAHFTEDAA